MNGGTSINEARTKTSISKGVLSCLDAAFISGLAWALSQKGVQMAGGKGRNPYLYSLKLGTYSSIALMFSLFATKSGRESLRDEGGVFKHWTPLSIVPVAVRALGAGEVLTSYDRLCLRYNIPILRSLVLHLGIGHSLALIRSSW